MLTATVLFASMLGYRAGGLDGMCLGAGIGWLGAVIGTWITQAFQHRVLNQGAKDAGDIKALIAEGFDKLAARLPPSEAFYTAVLDGLPIAAYRLMG